MDDSGEEAHNGEEEEEKRTWRRRWRRNSSWRKSVAVAACDVEAAEDTVTREGYLEKRCSGLVQMRRWQQRYFVATSQRLSYYRDQDTYTRSTQMDAATAAKANRKRSGDLTCACLSRCVRGVRKGYELTLGFSRGVTRMDKVMRCHRMRELTQTLRRISRHTQLPSSAAAARGTVLGSTVSAQRQAATQSQLIKRQRAERSEWP